MRVIYLLSLFYVCVYAQNRRLGKLTEVFAWKQLTYNINDNLLLQDRSSSDGIEGERVKRQSDRIYFMDSEDNSNWNTRYPMPSYNDKVTRYNYSNNVIDFPSTGPRDDPSSFYIKYNNVPMGAEKVGNRVFVTVPRRRYGIPSTLNYIDLSRDTDRSPSLRPYPSLRESRTLTSVYRTRADSCQRLWMVDTGMLEIPGNPQQVQPPAIVVFDLRTDRQIFRYQLKEADVPANNTPTGLASITVDTSNGCSDTFAYIPDLTTFGIVVYSLRENDSWRVTHNYMHFNPTASSLTIAGQSFQWSDGIFSITLGTGSCRPAYFHPLISTQEFSVSTCVLNNRTASTDPDYWRRYSIVGERGERSQSTTHDIHAPSGVVFYAEVAKDALTCWNTQTALTPDNVALLASDRTRLSYPSDVHVTGDEVWVVANSLPRYSYASVNVDEYNYFVYKANVNDIISGTVCSGKPSRAPTHSYNRYNK